MFSTLTRRSWPRCGGNRRVSRRPGATTPAPGKLLRSPAARGPAAAGIAACRAAPGPQPPPQASCCAHPPLVAPLRRNPPRVAPPRGHAGLVPRRAGADRRARGSGGAPSSPVRIRHPDGPGTRCTAAGRRTALACRRRHGPRLHRRRSRGPGLAVAGATGQGPRGLVPPGSGRAPPAATPSGAAPDRRTVAAARGRRRRPRLRPARRHVHGGRDQSASRARLHLETRHGRSHLVTVPGRRTHRHPRLSSSAAPGPETAVAGADRR